MSNEDLKPCPFCGSYDLSTNGHGAYTIVVCCECLAEGPHGHPSKAISRWNTRTCAEIDMMSLSRSDLENSYNDLRNVLAAIRLTEHETSSSHSEKLGAIYRIAAAAPKK